MKKEIYFGQQYKQVTIEFETEEQKEQYKIDNKIKEADIEVESETILLITKLRKSEFLRIGEASEITGLNASYIRNLAGKGLVPSYKQGKFLVFKPEELKQWVQDRTKRK